MAVLRESRYYQYCIKHQIINYYDINNGEGQTKRKFYTDVYMTHYPALNPEKKLLRATLSWPNQFNVLVFELMTGKNNTNGDFKIPFP